MSKFGLKKEYKLSEDSAMEQLTPMLEYFDLDVNDIKDEKHMGAIESSLDQILRDIRLGKIELKKDDKFCIVQHLENKSTIDYKIFGGMIKTAMAGKKKDDDMGRMYALLGAASGLGEMAIKSLSASDVKVAERLSLLFL